MAVVPNWVGIDGWLDAFIDGLLPGHGQHFIAGSADFEMIGKDVL